MLDYYLRKLSEAEGNPGKYFYIVGDGEISCSYFDSDTHMYMPDYHDLGDGYVDKQRFDTLQDVFNAIDEEGLLRADEKIMIPMAGNTESLNAAVAAGILMYERIRRR